MKNDDSENRLHHRSEEELESESSQDQKSTGRQFETVEDLLRTDARNTFPPPAVRSRLASTVRQEGLGKRPWWKRWLGSK